MGWNKIHGHDRIREGFLRAHQRGRLAHAYLFAGPSGVGKHLFAIELARALFCENPSISLNACDRCTSCLQIEAGTHPDFHVAARPKDSLEFPIELMRETCDIFSLKSARGRGKVVVVDDADDLNPESANCFLKTLEEPPAGSMIILIGTSPEHQLPTIRSRCQLVRFGGLSDSQIDRLLEENGVDKSSHRETILRLASGSPGLALQLADPGLWEMRNRLARELVAKPLDSVSLGRAWMAFAEESGKESSLQRTRAKMVLRLLIELFRAALLFHQDGRVVPVAASDLALLQELTRKLDTDQILDLLDRCMEADFQIDRRVQLVLVLESLVDHLAQRLGN